jgi:hypothetical protein
MAGQGAHERSPNLQISLMATTMPGVVEQKEVVSALLGAVSSLAGLGMAFTGIVLAGGDTLKNNLDRNHDGWPSYRSLIVGGALVVTFASMDSALCIYWLAGKGQWWLGDAAYWAAVVLAVLVTAAIVVFTLVCVPPLVAPARAAYTAASNFMTRMSPARRQ